jgi:hypothetical protein
MVVNPWVDLIADVILDNIEEAAGCSHRPDNVRFWLDANARYMLASKIADAVGYPSGEGEMDLDDLDAYHRERMTDPEFVEALRTARYPEVDGRTKERP